MFLQTFSSWPDPAAYHLKPCLTGTKWLHDEVVEDIPPVPSATAVLMGSGTPYPNL